MASSASTSSIARKRIRANTQDRKSSAEIAVEAEEEAKVAEQNAAAERILSQSVKAGHPTKKRRAKPKGKSTAQLGLLAAIVIGGIAAISGWRYLPETLGVHWTGESATIPRRHVRAARSAELANPTN